MKRLLKKIFLKIGYEVKKINKEINNVSINSLLKNKIIAKPLIIDVGGSRGQSIEKFKKIFQDPIIHSFEPIKSDFDIMYKKFGADKNVHLNNFALGDKIEYKDFYITAQTDNSSFNKINKDTIWLKKRSKQFNTTIDGYIKSKIKTKINTLDNYCKNKKIDTIDLLKIDTQGYEDKVLQGSFNILKKNNIKSIVTEIMFDDVYEKYFSFSDIEKYIIKNNFRMVAINIANNNLFSGLVFSADVCYFNKNYFDL
jgi:FkbM family methyltransferase